MSHDVLVTLVSPVYNRISLIPETIESVLSQTYKNWELILVDDGSDIATLELLHSFEQKDARIKIFERDRSPKGAPMCRNIGLLRARGDFIIFLDSDDLIETFCLNQRVTFMLNNPALDFAIFPGLLFNKTMYDKSILVSVSKDPDMVPMLLTLTPPCVPGNIIWKRETLIKKNVKWDENIKGLQDIDYHLTANYNGLSFQYADSLPDYFWRIHDKGNTGSQLSKTEVLLSHQYFFEKHFDTLRHKHKYELYKNSLNRLAGQLLLLSFKSKDAGDAKSMITFLKKFGNPLSKLNMTVLMFLGRCYTLNPLLRSAARFMMRMLYPSVFPLFKNKTFAIAKWRSPKNNNDQYLKPGVLIVNNT
jgi:glycosyltransferase involved in cell wall biosynthesis